MFWLGTHHPNWAEKTDVPLFISHLRLRDRQTLPRALGPVAIDSGAFSYLAHDIERDSPRQYATSVRRYRGEIGNVRWAAIQDWMCEPFILRKTGLTVREHQARTIQSYLDLTNIAPDLPWVPVLQGWQPGEYVAHARMYMRAGIDLRRLPLVGLGTVCRRPRFTWVEVLVRALSQVGVRLHGFGVKITGLVKFGLHLASADSMAWSFTARRQKERLFGHTHINCANCLEYALGWRRGVVDRSIFRARQLTA